MLLAGTAAVPLLCGLDLPFGSRTPVDDGLTEVRDVPSARALVLDDTFRQVAIVAVDLLTIDADLVKAAGMLVWDAVRIAPGRLMVVPTGVQTAPLAATWPGLPPRPEPFAASVAEQIAGAVIYAAKCRVPVTAGWGRGASDGLTPLGVLVLRLDAVDGGPVALLVELPYLPEGDGRVLSAGYPGEVVRFLERAVPGLGVVPLLGPAAGGQPPDTDPQRVGEQLGAAAWAVACGLPLEPDWLLSGAHGGVALPFALPDADDAAERLEAAEIGLEAELTVVDRRWATAEMERARQAFAAAAAGVARERDVPLQGVGLGDGMIVGCPLLSSAGLARRVFAHAATAERTLLAGGANGLFGVLTPPEQPLPALESWSAALPFAAEAAERFAAGVARLADSLSTSGL